jgi:hypothetical protein
MANNELGKLRRSAILMNYGPGAIIDFRAGKHGAAVSVVSAGLEQWDDRTYSKGLTHPQTIFEPRLQKKLGVEGFRMPPVFPDDEDSPESLLGVRFPNWLQCPACDTIADARSGYWANEPGDPSRYCSRCSAEKSVNQRVFSVPVRFVTACQNGHLDDFPWHLWVQHKLACNHKKELKLETRGSGLAGLHVVCPKCHAARSMEKIFKKEALAHLKCRGRRPHLQGDNEGCDLKPLTLQRGASNSYFPKTYSALDIPPWSDLVQKMLGQYWGPISDIPSDSDRAGFIKTIWGLLSIPNMTVEDLIQNVKHRIKMINEPERENLRWDEYQQLSTTDGVSSVDKEFEIRNSDVPESLENHLSLLVRAVRLREVRAQIGFTRIEPPSNKTEEGKTPIQLAPLSKYKKNWYPAIEVRGEGIFIQFDEEVLKQWENSSAVIERVQAVTAELVDSMALDLKEGQVVSDSLTARFLMVHTLAHILMKQLSLECGYSSASLRERLFIGEAPEDMAGLLIYTATSDSDGTLGGLQRQGLTHRFEELFLQAIRSSEWCSSDPLCIEGLSSATDATNLAACHSCVLSPETSCEEFNRFLDRGLVVGTPDNPELGFFRELLLH